MSDTIILVGHGGTASDMPREWVQELKKLEGERQARRELAMSPREAALDKKVREWPRTPETDPYQAGIERLAADLRKKLSGRKLVVAYNEFCAPSVDEAIDRAVAEGAASITLVTTMFTPGGVHSEIEIPDIVKAAQKRHPHATIRYAWPFDMAHVAEFLSGHLARAR